MSTLALSLTGLTSSYALPGTYVEVAFAQGVQLGNPNTPKILLMGVKTSAGSATVDTQVYSLPSEADAIAYFGTGSNIHRAFRRISQVCPTALVYGIAVTESGGTAATGSITYASAATAAGKTTVTICGETVEVAIASGDAFDTAIAEAVKNAINAQTHWPVTAARVNGAVNLTYRHKGTNGNLVRYRATITSGITTTCTAGGAVLSGGVTDETYTTALTTVDTSFYDYVVPCVNTSATSETRFAAVSALLTTWALPTNGKRAQSLVAHGGSLSNATTFAVTYNKARNQVLWQLNPEWEPFELAAQFVGVRYSKERGGDPGVSYDNYGLGLSDAWFVPGQYAASDWPTPATQNSAIVTGLTPIAVQQSTGKSYVVMSVTAAGTDPRVRDTCKVTVSDSFAADMVSRFASQYNAAKLADNDVPGAPPAASNVCTPDRLRANTIAPIYVDYYSRGLLTNVYGATGTLAQVAVGIDPIIKTRINARTPLNVTPLLHQFAVLVSETSSG